MLCNYILSLFQSMCIGMALFVGPVGNYKSLQVSIFFIFIALILQDDKTYNNKVK